MVRLPIDSCPMVKGKPYLAWARDSKMTFDRGIMTRGQ
nr:MAG TPA: hypothetical protein [Bacteriophage sp.]